MTVVDLKRETRWVCYACLFEDRTFESQPHTRFHACPRYGGFTMPMVEAGVSCKVQFHAREDYVGKDVVQTIKTDELDVPVMSVTVTRDEGEDCTVYAPVASVKGG